MKQLFIIIFIIWNIIGLYNVLYIIYSKEKFLHEIFPNKYKRTLFIILNGPLTLFALIFLFILYELSPLFNKISIWFKK